VGTGRQGQCLGESRSIDRGADQGVDEFAGTRAGDRGRGGRAANRPRSIARACGPPGGGGRLAHLQAGWIDGGAFVRVWGFGPGFAGSPRSGSRGRAGGASSCNRAGCRGSRALDPRFLACRNDASSSLDFSPGCRRCLDGPATAGSKHTAPPGAPGRFLGDSPQRWTAFGTHPSRGWPAPWLAGSGTGPAPRVEGRSAGFRRAGRGGFELAAPQAGRLHVVCGNPVDDPARGAFGAVFRRVEKAGRRGRG